MFEGRLCLYTSQDLKEMQAWDLNHKTDSALARIMEWYSSWDNHCYVSFSGGKDSTVLADLAAQVCKIRDCKLILWFSDTGLEYPEVRSHALKFGDWLHKKYDIEVETVRDYPKDRNGKRISFRQVIEKYGYPVIGKEVAQKIYEARRTPFGTYARRFDPDGEYATKYNGRFSMTEWKWLKDSDIPISHECCNVMKKNPAKKYEKTSGNKPIVATMAVESRLRKTSWMKSGCNAFDAKRPIARPMSVWTDQDVLRYLRDFEIPYASVYGEIVEEKGKLRTTGCDRTGCIYCMFGIKQDKEPNRFQRLKVTHPKLWEYCMKPWEDGGLGIKRVLDFIKIKSE